MYGIVGIVASRYYSRNAVESDDTPPDFSITPEMVGTRAAALFGPTVFPVEMTNTTQFQSIQGTEVLEGLLLGVSGGTGRHDGLLLTIGE